MAQDILITPGSGEPQILFRGSGTTDTAVELNVLSSYQSGTGSGTALLFEGTEGQLFGITDNLSSGTIFSVADITGLPTIEVNSDGQVILCEYGSGTIIYNDFIGNDSLIHISGVSLGASGIRFSDGTTQTTVSTAGSGLTLSGTEFNVYGGSGNFQQIDVTSDNTFMPKMVFTGSGVTDTPVTMKVLSSFGSVSTSGTALSFEGTQGQLFGITDNLSSGNIFTVNDITGLPLISANADGQVILCEYGSGTIVYNNLLVSGVSTFDKGIKTKISTQADAATVTFDMDQSNVHMVTLGDNRTLAVSNVGVGQKFLVRLQQDSTGSRTVTWWGNIKWAEGGTEPTLTTTAHKADLFGFLSPSGGYYDGFVIGQDI